MRSCPNQGFRQAPKLGQEMIKMVLLLAFMTLAHTETVQISDGDYVECVDKNKQPAFEHPLLKHHIIQESPSVIPRMTKTKTKSEWQTHQAHPNTFNCPDGMIPVLKTSASANSDNINATHEYAIGSTGIPSELYGAEATINVWSPTVENEGETSISQIWISSRNYDDKSNLNTIEVGWQILPDLYQDNKPRLFIYWTSDGYNSTGCYNLECAGFIQTSSNIIIGGAITPVSAFQGKQYEITISVWKDPKHGNWWLSIGTNNSVVGYWPAEIFTRLANYAKEVQWGGETVDLSHLRRHSRTQMGSGHFPDESFGKASYFRNLMIVDNNNNFQRIRDITMTADSPRYYNIRTMFREDWGTYCFYGGPGFSPTHSGVAFLHMSWFSFVFLSFILYFII